MLNRSTYLSTYVFYVGKVDNVGTGTYVHFSCTYYRMLYNARVNVNPENEGDKKKNSFTGELYSLF